MQPVPLTKGASSGSGLALKRLTQMPGSRLPQASFFGRRHLLLMSLDPIGDGGFAFLVSCQFQQDGSNFDGELTV